MRAKNAAILVVGNDEFEGEKLSKYLADLGHQVMVANDVEEAIMLADTRQPMIVFFDMTISEFADISLVAKFKNSRVIAIVDEGQIDKASHIIEMGADDFLFKPFNLTMLKTRLNVWLEVFGASQFAMMMVFELKVPLTSIQGFSALLLSGVAGELTDVQGNFVKTIKENADRFAKYMANFVDLARVENKYIHPLFQKTSLGELARGTITAFQPSLLEKRQHLSLQIPENLPMAWADHYRLVQVISTLLDNSSKYSPEDGQIGISVDEGFEEGVHFLIVTIQDNGIGIPFDEQGKVFVKWWRSEHEKVREHAGYGLNLYIAKHLIEAQGGRIWFESELDKGTTFHFTVPVAIPPST